MIYITALKEVKRRTEDAYTGYGPLPIGALLFIASAAHEVFEGVNQFDHVSLEEGYVFRGMVWVVVWEYELRWR